MEERDESRWGTAHIRGNVSEECNPKPMKLGNLNKISGTSTSLVMEINCFLWNINNYSLLGAKCPQDHNLWNINKWFQRRLSINLRRSLYLTSKACFSFNHPLT
jgi:hypothetical protein